MDGIERQERLTRYQRRCLCGRTYAALRRESDHIRETVGPMAQAEFDTRHMHHDDRITESEARALDGNR